MGLPVEDVDEVLLATDYKPLALAASLRVDKPRRAGWPALLPSSPRGL
jgi:hypothetical protein